MPPAVVLLFSLALCGCGEGIERNIAEAGGPVSFTATIDASGPATRTLLDASTTAGRDVLWQDGDKLTIGGKTYVAGSLSPDKKSAVLTPKLASELAQKDTAGKYEAWYPAAICNAGTPALPATQGYVAPTSAGGNLVVASHLPMYAQSDSTDLIFKNLCAVLNFQLKGTDKVDSVVVTSASKKLNGLFDVVADGTEGFKAQMKGGTATNAEKKVTLDCTGGESGSGVQLNETKPTEFCIAIPAQDYPKGDLTVTFYSGPDVIGTMGNPDNAIAAQLNTIYKIEKELKTPKFSVTYISTTTRAGAAIGMPPVVTYDGGTTVSNGTPVAVSFTRDTFIRFDLNFQLLTNMAVEVTLKDEAGNALRPATSFPAGNAVEVNDLRIPANYTYTLPTPAFQPKPFTVAGSPVRKVYFSQGNLQYRASTNTWRFADNQLDYVGDDKGDSGVRTPRGTVYQDGVQSNNQKRASDYTGWIDLFGWGTTGINYRSLSTDEYQPWTTSGIAANYGPVYDASDLAASSLSVSGQSDWGVNEILAGSTVIPGGTYRTLTREEWLYLLNHSSYLFAELPFGRTRTLTLTFASIEDPSYAVSYQFIQPGAPLWGLILFPDGFMEDNAALVSSYPAARIGPGGAEKDQWTAVTNWPELEAAGCVFLSSAEIGGHYWSATSLRSDGAEGISHGVAPVTSLGNINAGRHNAYLVRLVKDVSATGNATNETEPYTQGGTITTR